MPTEPETVSGTEAQQPVPQLQREAILPTADRGRLAAIVATCSMAGLAGGMALSMLAEAQRAAASTRSHRGPQLQLAGDFVHADGEVTWLGLQITDADPRGRECRGARVRQVVSGSPAAREGFRRGDLVVSFGGDLVCDADHLIAVVRASAIGATPAVGVGRGAETVVLHPELDEMPDGIRAKIRR